MGSLTSCLKKAGESLDQETRLRILARAAELRRDGQSADAAALAAVNELIAEARASIEALTGQVETEPEPVDTDDRRNADDDSAASTPSPALDREVAEGPESADASDGARKPRARTGRADARSVRGARGRAEGVDDGGQDVGDGRGDALVPDRSPHALARHGDRVPAPDFRAGPGALTREGSWYDTAARNVDLIELARKIEAENRPATPDEQARLAKYVGFGASEIRNALFPVPSAYAKSQDPTRLIWPNLTRDARWKALAERLDALPRDWQRSVLQSTQYAHYTSEGVIRSIWSGLQRMGFTGGKLLEPGMGIGSFAMLMPDAVRTTSRYTGIEFDGPTALIARLLSPQQNMLHDDFIKRRLPRDFFDVAIGNPPFSQTRILGDPDYEKHGFMLHDFFFAKSIDRVRPGGLLVFVTSKGTMDKQSDKARKYLADRADLLGAIRLPQTAFEDNAGTKVVTDILFLRKREPGQERAGHAWENTKTIDTKDGPAVVNEYFAANPDMVLGQQRLSGNRDDQGRYISGLRNLNEYTVITYDETPAELDAKVAKAVERLPQNVYSPLTGSSATVKRETAKVDFDPKMKREGVVYVADDGTLMRVENGVGVALADGMKLSDKDAAWFKGYVGLRELVQVARSAQATDGDWQAALKALNKAYDVFRAEHGPINDFRTQVRKSTDEEGREVETTIRIFKNRRLFREDYDAAVVTQLETINEAGDIVKAPFLLGRTIGKPVERQVKTVGDALAVSLDENGRLDLDDIARRIGITRDEAIEALGTQVYRTPQGQWQLADEYLSGDVVAKLDEAMDAARLDPGLQRNVVALKRVQPEKLGPSQISVKLGAGWIPEAFVSEFAKEIGAGAVTFDPRTESWQVEGGNLRSERRAGAEFGTADRSASELLEAALNSRPVTIKKRTEDKKEVTDANATAAASEMTRKIRDKFKSWIWTDTERATELVELYNRWFNNIAPRRFDGSHMTLPGVSLRFKLHPHQLRAIWRQVQTGNTYLAHAVGAGKTIEMIAGGMEQKRLGLINKPMYVVPNHMLEQFANEFMELYPLANIMVADDENFSAERRKAFVAAATLNAPDAIIITHSAFERIGVKEESVAPIRDALLAELEMDLDDAGKSDRVRRSQLEQQIEAVTQRFDSIIGAGKKDSTIKFEDIGADYVYVDEAHAYRKLDFTTNQKIKGIDPNGSRRALDMFVKTRWLERQRPSRSMTFASGTPVTNTMGELYTIMRFFAQDELDRGGMATFDGWSRQFGESVSSLEANAAGKYEVVERFAKFDNVPELMSRVRQFMDVLTSEHLGALVKRPDLEGGKPNLVTVEASPALKAYMKAELVPRLEASRRWKPSKDEPFNPDPVIAITSDGRFAALDPRFFGAEVDESTPTKMTVMADAIAAEYKATAGNAYRDKAGTTEPVRGGTQIVFYNLGFGEQSQKNRGFNARGALTKRLVDKGVKRDHILWFDDADTDAKKEAMFKAMRSGQARILIGSAKKMGTGVNVQKRLTMLHYFDPPWFPSDVEQPHGRIIRQGNQNERVRINWYATKGTYDATMWQMVGRKQRFIDQAFTGDKTLRSMDDMSEASVYEQAAAVASGDPRAMQLAGLRQDVERLERLQAAHHSEQVRVRNAMRAAEWDRDAFGNRVKTYGAAFKVIGERYFAFSTAKVGRATFDKMGDFGAALKGAFNQKAADHALDPNPDAIDLGTVGDLPIRMHPSIERDNKPNGRFDLVVHVGDHQIEVLNAPAIDGDDVGLARRVVNAVNTIERSLAEARTGIAEAEAELVRLRKKVGAPFEHAHEMVEKYADLKRLEDELKAEGAADAQQPQGPTVIDEDGNAAPRASRAVPFVAVQPDAEGRPTFHNPEAGIALDFPQVTERVEVIEGEGEQVVSYAVMPAEGFDVLGHVELLLRDGKPVSLLDIEVYGKGAGVGRKVIETLLAANPGADLNISNVVPEARGFWAKMGIPEQNVEGAYDGTLNWQTYAAAAGDRRAEGGAAQASRAADQEPDASREAGVPAAKRRSEGSGRETQGLSAAEAAAILALPEETINRVLGRRPGVERIRAIAAALGDGIDVRVVGSINDMPPSERGRVFAKTGGGKVRGAYFPDSDRVWLVADRLHSEAEATFVLLHEAFHRGLARTIGPDAKRALRQMHATNPALREAAQRQMKAHGIGLDEAIEEALADMAGKGEVRDLKGWQRLVDMIRGWLSDIGQALGLSITWTDDMIADFVAGTARAGLRGEPHVNGAAEPSLSRAGGMEWLREQRLPLGYQVDDLLRSSPGRVSWWHKTVGTMHNLAERSPAFKRVYDAAQRFLQDVSLYANEAADLAPNLLPRLEGLRDLRKMPLSAEDTRAIAAPIFEGTLRWTRDDRGEVVPATDVGTAGVVWTDAELRDRFKATDKQVGLYREFRRAVDHSLTYLAVSDMIRYGGSDVETVRAAALAAGDVTKAAKVLTDHLAELAGAAGKDRAATISDTGAKIMEKAERARDLMARGYAPLSRFGHYTLDVTEGAERVYFGLFETEADANRMARQMRKQYPKATIQQGTQSDEAYRMFAGVSPETLELFGEMLGLETQGDDAASKAFQEYLKLTKSNRSAMKRLIERKGIEGFSEDAGRVLAGFVYSNARQTAKNLHMGDLGRAVQTIAEEKGQGELLDAAVRLHQYITNPQEEGQAIRGLMFTQFLGGSIAAGLVNMTQPFMVTFPYLSQWGGVASAAARMTNAVRDAVKKETGDAALDAALKRAEEEGIVSPQEVHSLIAQARGAGALKAGDGTAASNAAAHASNFMSKLMLLWGRPFALAEQFNRRVTFIAAYRTAVAEGMPDPSAFAERVIAETQFTYNRGNRPQWARSAVGGALFTFKQYSISYVELLSRLAASGPDGKRAALLALAMLVLVSGLEGLPGAGDLDDLIDGLLQRLGFNFSSKQAKREFLAGVVGEGGAQFLMKGVSGIPGVPIDVAGRLGLGNLVPGTGLMLKKADHSSDLLEVAGPAGSLAKQVGNAIGAASSGNVGEAVKSVLPVAAANVAKAYDMASMGMYRDTRGRKVLDVDGYDAFVKAIGFQPTDVARVQQAAGEVQRTIDLVKMRESEIAERWARGVFEQDTDAVREARAELAKWNRDNPSARIVIADTQIKKRVQAMRMSRQERVEKTAPREIREQVRRELETSR